MLNTILRGHYKIISHLGGGGFGQTYLAEDIDLPTHPICVVKQLKPVSNEPFVLETAKRLFDQEAAMLYSLGSHDRIPRLLAHFQEGEEFYLVQEFADGTELTHEIGKDRRSPESVAIALLKEVLEILVYVHSHNVIHRDIKPANLIRRKGDRKIVLIDFGAVKEIGSLTVDPQGNTNLSIAIGSSGYMPIEQLNGKPRFSSDIYALGMMIVQAITGAEPRHFDENPDTAELVWRDRLSQGSYSPHFLDILDKMIRYDFRQRYQTANEVLEAIAMLPSVTEQAFLPTTLLHGNNNSVSSLATVVVSPQVRSPYVQGEHPSQLHTVAFQKSSLRRVFPLWMWISGGALLLLITIMALIGKSVKNVPEVINTPSPTAPAAKSTTPTTTPSPTVTPTPTATPSPTVTPPTPTATPSPTVTPTPMVTPSPTVTPTPTVTPIPTDTPTPIPSPEFQPPPQDIPAPLINRQPPSKKGGKKK